MKKPDLIKQVARRNGIAPGAAADQMDRAVNQILRALRNGHTARLPGLGVIRPGKPWMFRQEALERASQESKTNER